MVSSADHSQPPIGAPAVDRYRSIVVGLLEPPIIHVPIRHHSPACSRALMEIMERHRPSLVLVEGPPSFDDVIELLVDPTARMPLAVYAHATFAPIDAGSGDEPADHDGDEPDSASGARSSLRAGSYFPLCDYSPELVALREGRRLGADLGFVDLDHVELARFDLTRFEADQSGAGGGPGSTDERYYRFSDSLTETARRLGCRDHNELWDQMVEANSTDPTTTLATVLTYAAIARADADPERLHRDGTMAREAAMASLIVDRHQAGAAGAEGPTLVVTGAFHTVVLPDLIDALLTDGPGGGRPGEQEEPAATTGPLADAPILHSGHGLIRYGFERLEALSGYAAGMPNPRWYQRLWEHGADAAEQGDVAIDMLAEIAADLRAELGGGQPSLPSLIDAVAACRRLAQLRRRTVPTRHDLVDAAVTCFTKGEDSPRNPVRLAAARRLTGFELGRVPDGTPRSPLAADFDRLLDELGVNVDTSEPRTVNLDVYRRERDRRLSRFLHGLDALSVSFGRCITPLRFQRTAGRELIRERWTVVLGPATDSSLAEAAVWGSSITEAVAARTRFELDRLLHDNSGSAQVMAMVMAAARRGVHDVVTDGIDAVRAMVAVDPDLTSVVGALTECELLWQGREPLGGRSLSTLPDLASQLYARACQLGGRLHATAPDAQPDLVAALVSLYQLLAAETWDDLDPELFWAMVAEQRDRVEPGRLRGAIAGLEWRGQRLDDDSLIGLVRGHLDPMTDPGVGAPFLAGLLTVAREVLWEVDGLIAVLSSLLSVMDQAAFVRRVPGLRSAFAALTPQETDRVAEIIRVDTGLSPNVNVIGIEAHEVLANELLGTEVTAQLEADDLGHWLIAADHDVEVAR